MGLSPRNSKPLRAGHGCESVTSVLHLVLSLHDLDLALSVFLVNLMDITPR